VLRKNHGLPQPLFFFWKPPVVLHDGQGGRLGSSECMNVTLTMVLHITMSHLITKTPLGLFESDAEACFDRIVMLMAFLAFKLLGAPTKPLQMWERTLHHVQHLSMAWCNGTDEKDFCVLLLDHQQEILAWWPSKYCRFRSTSRLFTWAQSSRFYKYLEYLILIRTSDE
jgi:hypothetical protein